MVRVALKENQAQLTFELVNPLLQLRNRNLESLCGTLDVEFFCESNRGPVKTMIHSLQSTSSGGGGIPIRLHSVWLNTMSFAGGRSLEFRRGKAMSLTGSRSDDFRRIRAEMALRHVGVSRALECALDLSFSSTLHDEFCATNSHLTIV